MTQRVWSQRGEPSSATRSSRAHGETPLVGLIRDEFAEERLKATLDLGSERIPERLWTAALEGPLVELLGRPGKDFRSRLVEVAYQVSARSDSVAMPEHLPRCRDLADGLDLAKSRDASTQRVASRAAPDVFLGVPLAINAGNWYILAAKVLEKYELASHIALRCAVTIAACACHYGQALDLERSWVRFAARCHEGEPSTRLEDRQF